jgi:cell division protein FtsB
MVFEPLKHKNGGMPARHISSQSFDEILSDLGDDPAIPDPHGIRKPPPQPRPPDRPSTHGKNKPLGEVLGHLELKNTLRTFAVPLLLSGVFIAAGIAFFIVHNSFAKDSQNTLEESQKQINALKREITLMRDEIDQDIEELYLLIDEMEVSVHSLKDKKPEIRVFSKPQAPNHESELRRWRYLGSSQMGSSHQAYFHTGKNHLVFDKGASILGDWRLSNIEKESATFAHPLGKSIVLKASKAE